MAAFRPVLDQKIARGPRVLRPSTVQENVALRGGDPGSATKPAGGCSMVLHRFAGKPSGGTVQQEATIRLTRRMIGQITARTAEMRIESRLTDPRTKTGNVKLPMRRAITAVVTAIASGCKGFGEMEHLTKGLGAGARSKLNLTKRIPDTTAGDLLARLNPAEVQQVIYDQVRQARDRKQLDHDLPVRAVAVDGKYTTTFIFDPSDAKVKYGQVNSTGLCKVGTLTACLVSTPSRACLDAYPIPPTTNEMGTYVDAVDALLGAYGRTLFDVVMFDAGGCSLANATATIERGLDYVFCLRDNQSELLKETERVLACRKLETADAVSYDLDGDEVVIRRLWRTSSLAGWLDWTHLRTVLRLHTTRTDKTTGEVKTENRYYISSLAMDRLTAEQWQELIRRRWSVENQNHNIWDRIFQEDDRPWLRRPQGMVVMMLLRRLTYNVLAIYRSVTTRSERKRAQPWKELMQDLRDALIRATHQLLEGLRRRATATV
jgi:predicted transposase YbfD/YdcC